ncbi:hypothetical protein DH2020_011672 [Rehmannia glutinosa]|uniref:F-box domain-containing protein n=1 Tax=Rehmannia glutinosa TaxID=99300 RepID=A0ABR0XE39_REHGL
MERAIQSSRKRNKVSDRNQNMPSIDRLSVLPDEVICHILSFLPTWLSVKTSILARRWRFLWAHVPNLDFDFNNEEDDYLFRLKMSFPGIVNRVLSLHRVQSLNSFSLFHMCTSIDDSREFQTCIATVIERNVRKLDLALTVELPQCFLTCKTLVDLRIYDGVTFPSSGAISLPSLKKLCLESLICDVDLPHLISGCPVLEELLIEGPLINLECCDISSPTLKRLTINFPCASSELEPDYWVEINAPSLRYLKVDDCPYGHISISPITSLIEADISLPSDDLFPRCVLEFLDSLCSVKCLNLSCSYEFPDLGVAGSHVRFDNLTKLELYADWRFLKKFIESADHLEVLIIREDYQNAKNWMEPMEERFRVYSLVLVSYSATFGLSGFRNLNTVVNPETTIFNMERARQSSRKRNKVSDGEQNMASIDRLSVLPDEVICHILSFLPTKLSVATSILARRWRFLWAHVPNLDFNFEDDGYPRHLRRSFSSIVNRVMSLHKVQSLNAFRLVCIDDGRDDYEFRTCIVTAIERNVQILDLALTVQLPQCFLTCKTLVDLRIWGCIGFPSSGTISLPSLKKLCFHSLECEVDLPCLISGCPVLEELFIDGTPNFGSCDISSPTLKRLTIDFRFYSYEFNNIDYMVKINAPSLTYLDVCHCSYEHISILSINSLIEADIRLNTLPSNDFYARCVLKFLDSLCKVKFLKLSSYEFSDLEVAGSYVRFDNLTKLELAVDWRFLTKFLESADHLEVLIIHEGYMNSKNWMEPMEERCACLLHSLRTVRIDGFRCTEQSFNMVRYILRNAQVLKRMEIRCQRRGVGLKGKFDLKEKFDALRRISLFHRGSKECELDFC